MATTIDRSKDSTSDLESANFDDEEYKRICSDFRDSIFSLLRHRSFIKNLIVSCQNPKAAVYMSQRKKEIVSSLLNIFASVSRKRLELEPSINTTYPILAVPKMSYIKIAERTPLCDVLNFLLEQLNSVDDHLRLRNPCDVFNCITNGYSITKPFITFLTDEAGINQARVKIGAKKIEAFGALDDSAFREKLQVMSTTLLHIDDSIKDKAAMVMEVFNYVGCSEVLPGRLHEATTIFSGTSTKDFRKYLDVSEEQSLGGTLGGIVKCNNLKPDEHEEAPQKVSN